MHYIENEILLKAIEKLLDQKLNEKLAPVFQRLDSIDSRLNTIESIQQTILTFVKEVD